MEKRKHRRVKTYIECVVFDRDNNEEIPGFITDLSAHGIGILLKGNNNLKVGERYDVQGVKKFMFDKDYSHLIIQIEFTRFMKDDLGIRTGAKITDRYESRIEDYMHKIDVENYMTTMRYIEERRNNGKV